MLMFFLFDIPNFDLHLYIYFRLINKVNVLINSEYIRKFAIDGDNFVQQNLKIIQIKYQYR